MPGEDSRLDRTWFPPPPQAARAADPVAVYIPSADPQLVREVARLHAVVGAYQKAAAGMFGSLRVMAEECDEDGVFEIGQDDVQGWQNLFEDAESVYHKGAS